MRTCRRVSSLCSLGAICTISKWLAAAGQAAMGCNAAPDFICIPAGMLTVLEVHMYLGQSLVQGCMLQVR